MCRAAIIAASALAAACGAQGEADAGTARATDAAHVPATSPSAGAGAAPDLAACPARDPVDEGLRQRNKPIPVPAELRDVARSDLNNFAFSTLDRTTVCVEASWMESIREPALSPDKRFASFSWDGYEAYGHIIVDRSGKGIVIDTGVPPVASPSGNLLASADLSESGFGALSAFAVWQIAPAGLMQAAKQEQAPSATDWRIEGWAHESCVDLSAIAWEDAADATRRAYHASRSKGWRLEPDSCHAP